MRARDAMEFMNEQDEATIARFVERLEFRGRDETFTGYRDAYLDAMDLAPGGHRRRARLRDRRRRAGPRRARGLRGSGDRG